MNVRETTPRLVAALSALVVLCGATAALAAGPTYIERILTPDTPSHGAGEPQIAVSPTNPNNIVYVSTYYRYVGVFLPGPNQYGDPDYEFSFVADITSGVTFVGGPFDFLNCFIAVSEDRGETWTPGKWPNGNRPFCGDPMMHVDSNGIFYGAMDWMGHPTEQCTTANSSDPVAVFSSTDGGHNWSSPVSAGTQTDRPWMRVDAATGKLYEESGFFGRTLAVSADRGKTWSAPVDFTNGSHIAVYDGILATWGSGMFHFSTDDGQSYTSRPVTDPGGVAIDPVGLSGGWISADPTKKGRFAVMSRSGGNYQLWVTSDTGQTWTTSPPIPAPSATLPWMDFGWSGVLAVMWKNTQDGNVYSAISKDQGVTFSPVKRVNTTPQLPANGTCPGDDLSWIASDKDYTYIGWAHQRDGQCDGFFARVPLGCYTGTQTSSCPSF